MELRLDLLLISGFSVISLYVLYDLLKDTVVDCISGVKYKIEFVILVYKIRKISKQVDEVEKELEEINRECGIDPKILTEIIERLDREGKLTAPTVEENVKIIGSAVLEYQLEHLEL